MIRIFRIHDYRAPGDNGPEMTEVNLNVLGFSVCFVFPRLGISLWSPKHVQLWRLNYPQAGVQPGQPLPDAPSS